MNLENKADRLSYLNKYASRLALHAYINYRKSGKGITAIIATNNPDGRELLTTFGSDNLLEKLKQGQPPIIYLNKEQIKQSKLSQIDLYDDIKRMIQNYNPHDQFIAILYYDGGQHIIQMGGILTPSLLHQQYLANQSEALLNPFNEIIDLSIDPKTNVTLQNFLNHFWLQFAGPSYGHQDKFETSFIDIITGEKIQTLLGATTAEELKLKFDYDILNPQNFYTIKTLPELIQTHQLDQATAEVAKTLHKNHNYTTSLLFAISNGEKTILFSHSHPNPEYWPRNQFKKLEDEIRTAEEQSNKIRLSSKINVLLREELEPLVRKHIKQFKTQQKKLLPRYGKGFFFIQRRNLQMNPNNTDFFAGANYMPKSATEQWLQSYINKNKEEGHAEIKKLAEYLQTYNPDYEAIIVIEGDQSDLFVFKESYKPQ